MSHQHRWPSLHADEHQRKCGWENIPAAEIMGAQTWAGWHRMKWRAGPGNLHKKKEAALACLSTAESKQKDKKIKANPTGVWIEAGTVFWAEKKNSDQGPDLRSKSAHRRKLRQEKNQCKLRGKQIFDAAGQTHKQQYQVGTKSQLHVILSNWKTGPMCWSLMGKLGTDRRQKNQREIWWWGRLRSLRIAQSAQHMIKNRFFYCDSKHDHNWIIEITILSPSFNWKLKLFLAHF
jgi:hypothetical protein